MRDDEEVQLVQVLSASPKKFYELRGQRKEEADKSKIPVLIGGQMIKLRITQVVLTIAAMIVFTFAMPNALAQEHPKDKDTASGQMKEGGKETGRAGKSLGHNVKHGRVLHGGKRFGQHIGRAGKHVGHGTETAVKRAVKP
jgi:hypothetical protein